MCEFRDAIDAVTQRNFNEGQYVGTTAYLYMRDHLGSIREMFTGGGTVVARYDYDCYGRSTTVLGTTPTDFNFTGLYRHSKSGLDLATYRGYDPDLGRWLSRDPLKDAETQQGTNLYRYVANDPANLLDPEGLKTCWKWVHMTCFGDYKGNPKRGIPPDTGGAYKRGPLAAGDIAVGNYGAGPSTPKTHLLEGPNRPAYPAGSSITVYPSNSLAFTGRVSDWGAFNIKHPQYSTDGWIDIWDPVKSKKKISDEGWISFEIGEDCPCPNGSSG